jgi:cyclophilin family peptidyl-prolyl cis-trans isomerase
MSSIPINASTAPFCYIDLDIDNHRSKLARCAAFVASTNSRYGFSSSDLRQLGGSEVARIPDLFATDHEWQNRCSSSSISHSDDSSGIAVKPPQAGNRMVIRLYWDVAPLACENFATLCWNGSSYLGKQIPTPIGESGKPLSYRNSIVHRIQTEFVLQAGDFIKGNGSGGESIYKGKKFKDERPGLLLPHDRKGIVSMGNSGKNSNSSQFFITFAPTPQCNGKHVVFGEVVSGYSVLDYAASFGTRDGTPQVPVVITDCGLWMPCQSPGAGYWYDQPDEDSYTGVSSIFVVRPRVAIVTPTVMLRDRFIATIQMTCDVVTTVLLCEENEEVSLNQLSGVLERFAVDVILVAPTIRKELLERLCLPSTWVIDRSQVILVTKPVDALSLIHTKSWLAGKFPLDGTNTTLVPSA